MPTDEEWAAFRQQKVESLAFVGAMLEHMRRKDGQSVRELLENAGAMVDARATIMSMGEVLLWVISGSCNGNDDQIDWYIHALKFMGHGIPPGGGGST